MGTQVTVTVLPPCDFCQDGTPATYDARVAGISSWANMCETHWQTYTDRRLGTGFGQKLILEGKES